MNALGEVPHSMEERMLVLSRRVGEKVIIGKPPNEIVILVTEIHGHQVRLGIEAAKDVQILRSELLDRGRYAVPEVIVPNPRQEDMQPYVGEDEDDFLPDLPSS